MERVTNENLSNRVTAANRQLQVAGVGGQFVAQGRNGYTGLDYCDSIGTVIRTLTCGTKREVYDYLGAVIETAWLLA